MARRKKLQPKHVLGMIKSKDADARREGWELLRDRAQEFRRALSIDDQLSLPGIAFTEQIKEVALPAWVAMAKLALCPSGTATGVAIPAEPENLPGLPEPEFLSQWLWQLFRQPSAVLAVTATKYRRRDEGALCFLGRRLSFVEYPRTEFPQISLEKPELAPVLFSKGYRAFCVVGRLGLFGREALERLGDGDLRFGFDAPCRPKGLPPGELDPDYHCVFEKLDNGDRKSHPTVEANDIRTDYAVVQRYEVGLGAQRSAVVIVAGASSLGTMAAARWAAYDLFQPTDATGGGPIKVPNGITPQSRMEALLRVRAKVTTSAWENLEIRLLKLSVDGAYWCAKEREWREPTIQVITLVRENGEPLEILFDNQPSNVNRGSQIFRLLVAVVEQKVRRRRAELDITELAADDAIWDRPNPPKESVHAHLRTLRFRHLKRALDMRGTPRLLPEVREVNRDLQPIPAGGKAAPAKSSKRHPK